MALASVSHINGLPKPEVSIAETASRACVSDPLHPPPTKPRVPRECACVYVCFTRMCDYIYIVTCKWAFRAKKAWLSRTKSYQRLCRHSSLSFFLPPYNFYPSFTPTIRWVHLNFQLTSSHRLIHLLLINSLFVIFSNLLRTPSRCIFATLRKIRKAGPLDSR